MDLMVIVEDPSSDARKTGCSERSSFVVVIVVVVLERILLVDGICEVGTRQAEVRRLQWQARSVSHESLNTTKFIDDMHRAQGPLPATKQGT